MAQVQAWFGAVPPHLRPRAGDAKDCQATLAQRGHGFTESPQVGKLVPSNDVRTSIDGTSRLDTHLLGECAHGSGSSPQPSMERRRPMNRRMWRSVGSAGARDCRSRVPPALFGGWSGWDRRDDAGRGRDPDSRILTMLCPLQKRELRTSPTKKLPCRQLRSCDRGDSNPHRVTHWHLRPARLPIPPRSRACRENGRLHDIELARHQGVRASEQHRDVGWTPLLDAASRLTIAAGSK